MRERVVGVYAERRNMARSLRDTDSIVQVGGRTRGVCVWVCGCVDVWKDLGVCVWVKRH